MKKLAALLLALVMVLGVAPWLPGAIAEETRTVDRPDIEPMTQSHYQNFSNNYTLTGDGASDMIAIAFAQLGKTGSQLGYTEAWCADFVCDCGNLAGIDGFPCYGGCDGLINLLKIRAKFINCYRPMWKLGYLIKKIP